jgi:hypothetical protein
MIPFILLYLCKLALMSFSSFFSFISRNLNDRNLCLRTGVTGSFWILFDFYGVNYVSEPLPRTDILFIPQMIYEYGERWWKDTDRGKRKNSVKTLSQFHFVHHKSQGANTGLRGERPATNRLSHGTANSVMLQDKCATSTWKVVNATDLPGLLPSPMQLLLTAHIAIWYQTSIK